MARTLRYTRIVRHPETHQPTALVGGSELPEWADGLVHDDDMEGGRPARKAPAKPSGAKSPDSGD